MARKLIVTSVARMKAKYGAAGWARVEKAVRRLIAGDKARGVETTLVDLGGKAKSSAKAAIDEAFAAAGRPEYLAILGGPDVVPHQVLMNPAQDDDAELPSDLPYASDAKAGKKAEDFVAASRAVGRIPDLPGDTDPAFLVAQLEHAAKWKPMARKNYGSVFGLSAAQWKKSTELSIHALFGKAAKLRLSPREGPKWKGPDLAPRAHFINCHGAPSDPQFYGQSGSSYPTAHHAQQLARMVKPGTVVAAECCYGAELYDPPDVLSGICTTYLAEGALGFLGSTTIAYGPADSNGSADLVCRFFLEKVLSGASLGRALLEARQRFAEQEAPLSPIDLKTLGQFHLLGDPSLHAIATPATKAAARTRAKGALSASRAALESTAARLSRQLESVASDGHAAAPASVARAMESAAHSAGLVPVSAARTFEVQQPKSVPRTAAFESAPARARVAGERRPVKFHVMYASPADVYESSPPRAGLRKGRPSGIIKKVCLLGREVGGRVEIQHLWAKSADGDEATVRRAGGPEARRRRLQERARRRGPAD